MACMRVIRSSTSVIRKPYSSGDEVGSKYEAEDDPEWEHSSRAVVLISQMCRKILFG